MVIRCKQQKYATYVPSVKQWFIFNGALFQQLSQKMNRIHWFKVSPTGAPTAMPSFKLQRPWLKRK